MPKFEYLTHEDMNNYYAEVIRQMAIARYKPDGIIAPMRGGLDFGIKLSNFYDVPVHALHWQTRSSNTQDIKSLTNIVESYFGRNLLIVDDICDSGNTFAQIENALKDLTGSVIIDYAAAINNEDCEFDVTWAGRTIHRNIDTQWFVFPWEDWWKR